MARIRTVKPEFWSSEQVMACRPLARLLFIGLWNFCDDGGNHPLAPRTIKALVFPGDDISTEEVGELLSELEGAGLTQTYRSDGKHYLHVLGWRHQKIEKKSFKYPAPPLAIVETAASDGRAIDEYSTTDRHTSGHGREGERTGEHTTQRVTPAAADSRAVCEMTLDWVPDSGLLRSYALRMSIPVEHFTQATTAAFVCHYSASGRLETQAAWVSLLVKWVKRDQAAASNVRHFPRKPPVRVPDFDDDTWTEDLGAL